MERNNTSWRAFLRVAVVVGAIGASFGGEGCSCDSGPYVDNNDVLQCGDCPQYAFRCVNQEPVCAPDGPSAEMQGCTSWTEVKDCAPSGGETGGDDGGDDGEADGGESSSGGEPYDCGDWDPDAAVTYNSTLQIYRVDDEFVADLKLDPLPLTECDCTKAKMVSGGYFELYHVCMGDLAYHLGFQQGDIIEEVNRYELLVPKDYLDAYDALKDETEFEVVIDRQGTPITLKYRVR